MTRRSTMIIAQITDMHIRPEGVLAWGPVALDTLVPGQVGGLLCEERLGWLAARLAEAPDRPTVIFMHHPPFVTGIAYMDGHGLANAREFAEVVRRHPQLERVVCGHLHRPIQARVGGTLASTAPSTAHQVALDLGDGNPLMFTMEPPACLLHVWRPDTGLVSHTSYIGDFDGPYLFSDGSKVVGSGLSPARATRRLP